MDDIEKKFSELYDANIDKLYRFAFLRVDSAQTAQDLTAETFTRFWEQFKINHSGIKNPRAFLYAIAKNLIVDHYRDRGRINIVNADLSALQIIDDKNDIARKAEINSDMEAVKKAIAGLKEDYQNAVIWRYLNDLEISEVAQLLGKTEEATRVVLHRAMKELKTKLA